MITSNCTKCSLDHDITVARVYLFLFSLHVDSEAKFALIYWPEEACISVVKTRDILEYSSALSDGDTVVVKIGRQTYSGVLKKAGTREDVRNAEQDYLKDVDDSSVQALGKGSTTSRKQHARKESGSIPKAPAKKRKRSHVPHKKFEGGNIIVVDNGADDRCSSMEKKIIESEEEKEEEAMQMTDSRNPEEEVNNKVVGGEEEVHPPAWSSDNIYQPWPPEDEEELFRLCSPGTMFEDLSIEDMEVRNEPSPQEAKLQHMEDTIKVLSKKYADLLQRVELLESAKDLAGFAIGNPWEGMEHTTGFVHDTCMMQSPTDMTQAPTDMMQLPTDTMQPPTDMMQPSTDMTQAPTDLMQLPTCTEVMQSTGMIQPVTVTPSDRAESELVSVDEVLLKYPKLCCQKNVSRLAVKIARESIFGQKVMQESTPSGTLKLKKLAPGKLETIKNTIRTFFPSSDINAAEFELTWKVCIESISQACKHERKKAQTLSTTGQSQ